MITTFRSRHFLGILMRMFLIISEERTAKLLAAALESIEDGSFAALLKDLGFIEPVPLS